MPGPDCTKEQGDAAIAPHKKSAMPEPGTPEYERHQEALAKIRAMDERAALAEAAKPTKWDLAKKRLPPPPEVAEARKDALAKLMRAKAEQAVKPSQPDPRVIEKVLDHDQAPLVRDKAFQRRVHGSRMAGYVKPGPKIGRNDPCMCGSGKKFKRCCITKWS